MDFSNLKKWRIVSKKKNIYKVQDKNKIYIGELENYKPNGIGYYQSIIENYKGYWKDGKKNGLGYTFHKNGDKIYSGHWINNIPNGEGILFYGKNKIKYSGNFKDNFFNGLGILYRDDGSLMYRGFFIKSKYDGKGILYYKNNNIKYEGSWKNGKKNGYGKEFNAGGEILYEGEFKNNERNGFGYIYIYGFPYRYSYWIKRKAYNLYKPFPKSFIPIKSFLGEGGFGKLSLYQDKKTNKLYAVKFFKKEMDLVVQYRNLKYLKEKKVCSRYFLCPYGIFNYENRFCLAFTYLEGYITFTDFKKDKTINDKNKVKICSQMWKQIHILHRIGMIHCDIKSSNIMIDPKTLNVHIIDFGIAIIIDKKQKEKKYMVYGLTKKYFNLPLGTTYTYQELIENDLKTMSKIIFSYLGYTIKNNESDKKRFKILDGLLKF